MAKWGSDISDQYLLTADTDTVTVAAFLSAGIQGLCESHITCQTDCFVMLYKYSVFYYTFSSPVWSPSGFE